MRDVLAAMLLVAVSAPVQAQTSSTPSEFLQLSAERQAAYVDGILVDKFALDEEGNLAIPDGPGLGITLDRDAVARYCPSAAELFAET